MERCSPSASSLIPVRRPQRSPTGGGDSPHRKSRQGGRAVSSPPRCAYTGAFGLAGTNRAEFHVVIRSFEIASDRIELGAGGGITTDSVPMLEWRECLHKAAPLIAAAGTRLAGGLDLPEYVPTLVDPDAGVFETMLAVDGRIPWLAEHLARLAAGSPRRCATTCCRA